VLRTIGAGLALVRSSDSCWRRFGMFVVRLVGVRATLLYSTALALGLASACSLLVGVRTVAHAAAVYRLDDVVVGVGGGMACASALRPFVVIFIRILLLLFTLSWSRGGTALAAIIHLLVVVLTSDSVGSAVVLVVAVRGGVVDLFTVRWDGDSAAVVVVAAAVRVALLFVVPVLALSLSLVSSIAWLALMCHC